MAVSELNLHSALPPARIPRVLIAIADTELHAAIASLCQCDGYQTLRATNSDQVIELVQTEAPDLALLGQCDGPMERHELCSEVRQLDAGRSMAIVVIDDDCDDELAAVQSLLCGADDHFARPERHMELRARLRVQLRHCRDRAMLQVVRRERRRLKSAAMMDALTEVLNRRGGDEALRLTLADPESMPLLLLLVDIDHFKQVNDNFGHPVGDKVLRHVAQQLARMLRQGDHLARVGGEEFLLIIRRVHPELTETIANRFRSGVEQEQLRDPPGLGPVTISLGGCTWTGSGSLAAAESLLKVADEALYVSKHAGRNRVTIHHWYDPQRSIAAKTLTSTPANNAAAVAQSSSQHPHTRPGQPLALTLAPTTAPRAWLPSLTTSPPSAPNTTAAPHKRGPHGH